MPLPTTRYGRYVYRKQRYVRRSRKQEQLGWNYALVGGKWRRVGRDLGPNKGPVQLPADVSSDTYNGRDFASPFPPFVHLAITGGGRGNPPHVALLPTGTPGPAPANAHHRRANAQFHVRRVQSCRPRPGRMNGLQRQVWFHNWHYWANGYFLDLDPLSRHPNETDLMGGGEPDPSGTWPLPSPRDV